MTSPSSFLKTKSTRPWFECPAPRSTATLRMFCFPYAGGGASVYRSWATLLPAHVELIACQLPGRENRISEEPHNEIGPLLDILIREIEPFLDRPFVFFGHSLGGLISFELARRLQTRSGSAKLKRVFLSGCRPAHLREEREFISKLPEKEFIEALKGLDGTPEDFFKIPELMEVFLPIIRADFSVAESYAYYEAAPLQCPIEVYAGLDDSISLDDMSTWRRYTTDAFRMTAFPGNHFFINSHRKELQESLLNVLRTL